MITKPPYRKQSNEPKTVRDMHGKIIADFQQEEEADFAIIACNMHDHLMKMKESLGDIGRKLEVAGLLNLKAGDDYSTEAVKFLTGYAMRVATLHNPLVAALGECLNFIEHSQANRGKLSTADDWKRNVEDFRKNASYVNVGRDAVPEAECNLQSVRAVLAAAKSV